MVWHAANSLTKMLNNNTQSCSVLQPCTCVRLTMVQPGLEISTFPGNDGTVVQDLQPAEQVNYQASCCPGKILTLP
jgi:hypothetical protein